jgi:hypothetical protein
MARQPHPVTDHAVIRYLERVLGLDVDGLRDKIAEDIRPALRTGASAITKQGFKYMIVDGALVTILRANASTGNHPNNRGGGEE